MNPDIERVQHYLAIGQKVSAPEKQHEKRKPKKQNQNQNQKKSFEEVLAFNDELPAESESETAVHSDEHLDITT